MLLVVNIGARMRKMGNCDFTMNEHPTEKYWTINLTCKFGNSIYTDCVIVYEDEEFNAAKIIEELESIEKKASEVRK